jgi:hypothetical protein
MLQALRSLEYPVRWIVDRDDHVWCEVKLGDGETWYHIDPCEAAVNEPFIYQHWGKNQTFILAFTLDQEVYDVTCQYTNNVTAIFERRLQEGINSSYLYRLLDQAKESLRTRLNLTTLSNQSK